MNAPLINARLPLVLAFCLFSSCAVSSRSTAIDDEEGHHPSAGHVALWYIPNRIFDVLDIVRARLRLGPGLAFGARATELADIYLGTYGTVWAGLPGPRESRTINWPFGLESKTGAELSIADASVEGGVNYGFLEVGLGGQLLIIGADVGVDVWEALDFVTGLVCIDLVEDDL
jgi:hypothetical protein